jgi:hypothetical protein
MEDVRHEHVEIQSPKCGNSQPQIPISRHVGRLAPVTNLTMHKSIKAITTGIAYCLPHHSPHIERPLRSLHDPPNFERCNRLQALLARLKHHILESDSTRQCYAFVCERIVRELREDSAQSVKVSADYVKAHFALKWPGFVPLRADHMKYKDEMHWGRVDEGSHDLNEIELDPDLVRAAEHAADVSFSFIYLFFFLWFKYQNSDLLVYLTSILLIVIFHELMYHLAKFMFGLRLTVGDGVTAGALPMLGLELEEMLFSGVVCAIWDKGETAEIGKVRCLVIEYKGYLRDLRKSFR